MHSADTNQGFKSSFDGWEILVRVIGEKIFQQSEFLDGIAGCTFDLLEEVKVGLLGNLHLLLQNLGDEIDEETLEWPSYPGFNEAGTLPNLAIPR